ncbi:hypothetical protein L2737_16185 [Shewanella electrodiphila]|uniref:Transposase n=1 Tax=Shewanella electrodiphila TaxID=934143 RepID=A0ABT0KST4_9GAMM|nr:hypothetical protein [Shewanella electrodiphila]MCL1046849.1 hypothetical protein [Shewanella electrodiphila]
MAEVNHIGHVPNLSPEKGKESQLNYRYYISSTQLGEQGFAESLRVHWGVESSKGSIPAKQKRDWMKTSYLEAILIVCLNDTRGEF